MKPWVRARIGGRPSNRRRFLAGAGGLGATGLILAGCGGDSDKSGGETTTGAASSPVAASGGTTTAPRETPKQGGAWRSILTSDPPSLDPFNPSAVSKGIVTTAYSRLFMVELAKPNKAGVVPLNPVPDAAQSIEAASDGLSYTVKLRPNVKFHPPVNRMMNAEDVVYSWQRFTGRLPGTQPAPNSDRMAMIEAVQAVDDLTVVFRLNRPHASFALLLSESTLLMLVPKEMGAAFDPTKVMVGSGPWMFDRYETGSVLSFKRHPEWHLGSNRPHLETYTLNIIKEYATALNQFLGGNVDALAISGQDMSEAKKKIPGVQFSQRDTGGLVGAIGFAQVTNQRAGAPWTDIRVRRALSMAIDRDTILDVAWNLDKVKDAGLDVPYIWGGILPPAFGDIVVDPKTDPDASKYFKYDPKAAKALLDEAGGGFSVDLHYTPTYGPQYAAEVELVSKYWNDIGVRTKLDSQEYASKWIPQTQRGNFPGIAMFGQAGIVDPGDVLKALYSKSSAINFGKVDDPKVEEYLGKYASELDAAKRTAVLKEFQKYLLDKLYYVPWQWAAGSRGFVAYQPGVRGPADFQTFGYGSGPIELAHYWKA